MCAVVISSLELEPARSLPDCHPMLPSAGLDVRVAIIHSYAPPSFTSQLPADVAALPSLQPYNTRGTLPYFLTTFANPPEPFRMSNVQANLLDALQCWVIETEARQGGALHDFVERQRRGTAL